VPELQAQLAFRSQVPQLASLRDEWLAGQEQMALQGPRQGRPLAAVRVLQHERRRPEQQEPDEQPVSRQQVPRVKRRQERPQQAPEPRDALPAGLLLRLL